MKRIVYMLASAVMVFGAVACGGKSDKKTTETAQTTETVETQTEAESFVPERVEVTITTPAEDVAILMKQVDEIDSMIEQVETTGDDTIVPTIQEMVMALDRSIVACAKAYSDRSEEEFAEFCALLDVDPDHMREGFTAYGY